MRETTKKTFWAILCVAVLAATVMTISVHKAEAQDTVLKVSDCIKCHQKEPATIARNGGKHKTEISCLDCHIEHPPQGTQGIPLCSKCHTGKNHYSLENCLSCHSDPHEPLALVLANNIVAPCLTCHEPQGKEFKDFPSKHSQQSCTFCHPKHGLIPECSECHSPHAPEQKTADCIACHKVHHPKQIEYAETTPRSFCVACHQAEGELMNKTVTKHQTFTCAFCHKGGMHPVVPQCQGCHGLPHSESMHKKMPNCLDCHLDAHNLVK